MTKPLQSFSIVAEDGNTVSLGQADTGGVLIGVHIKGTAFPTFARISAAEAAQLAEVLEILLTKPGGPPSKTAAPTTTKSAKKK